MKTKISLLLTAGLFGLAATSLKAQVAINNTSATPNASAILDLQTGNAGVNKGFLPQSVALTNVTVAAPVVAPAAGLIVYSSSAPAGGNGTGYYYWNGTAWASMNSNIYGSGINNYVARWTPNGNTLGTGLIQDDGSNVGINTAPSANYEVYCAATAISAIDAYTGYAAGYGVGGFNYAANGTGVYGASGAGGYGVMGDGTYYGGGNGGYFTDGEDYALAGDAVNTNGITAFGTKYGVYGTADSALFAGVYGEDDNWIGVEGVTTYAGGAGVAGYNNAGIGVFAQAGTYGVYSYGATMGGYMYDGLGDFSEVAYNNYGVYASGNDTAVSGVIAVGNLNTAIAVSAVDPVNTAIWANSFWGGIFAAGQQYGGWFQDGKGDEAILASNAFVTGGYFTDQGGDYSYVAYAGYGILSSGVKSTMVKDENNQERVMYCNESPEVKFEDYGEGQLVNGKAHITLDPLLAKNVTINEKHPLQAFIQLEGDCNGVYVSNKSVSGFDVVELNHGSSNTQFSWHIVANRSNTVNAKGETYAYADWRFPVAPKKLNISASNPNGKAHGNNVAKAAPLTIPAIADAKQSHKGTVVKQPAPIKHVNNGMNVNGQSDRNQPNTQK